MKEPKLRFKADDGAKFPDWEKNNFSDVFDSINNSTFSRDCLNYVDGNVKYIHYGDILTIFDSTVNAEASNVPYVNKDIDCQKYQLLADGDIIVADTAEDDTVGKSVEITNASNVKMISGLHTIACRPKLKFASGYLGYYMNSNPYHNQLRPYMQGIKVTSISKANIALTNVSIPSLLEQQKIASLFPDKPVTAKPAETRMGSGKGALEYWVAVVKPGRVMFEIAGVPEEIAREALRLAMHKLPCKCKIVSRADLEGGDNSEN